MPGDFMEDIENIPRDAQIAMMVNQLALSYIVVPGDGDGSYSEFRTTPLSGQHFVRPGDTVLYEGDYAIVMRVHRYFRVSLVWANRTPFDDGFDLERNNISYRSNISMDHIRRLQWGDVAPYFENGDNNCLHPHELLHEFLADETGASGAGGAASGGAASGGAASSESEVEVLGQQLCDARQEQAAAEARCAAVEAERAAVEAERAVLNTTLRQRVIALEAQRNVLTEKLNALKRKREASRAPEPAANVNATISAVAADIEHRRRRNIYRGGGVGREA
tara:strand:- start:901 stop:1734 length:834 start_codon:yes stop_codon:yes gene_type:complete